MGKKRRSRDERRDEPKRRTIRDVERGDTRRRIADAQRDLAREDYERRRARDDERARRGVEENARDTGKIAPDSRAGNPEYAKRRRRSKGRGGGSLG